MALLVTLVARGRLEFTLLRCVWAVATMTSSCTCTSARLCCRFKIEFALLCAFNRIYCRRGQGFSCIRRLLNGRCQLNGLIQCQISFEEKFPLYVLIVDTRDKFSHNLSLSVSLNSQYSLRWRNAAT